MVLKRSPKGLPKGKCASAYNVSKFRALQLWRFFAGRCNVVRNDYVTVRFVSSQRTLELFTARSKENFID